MSYRICANDLPAGELQAEIMLQVANTFESINKKYFVIGATARDILAKMLKCVPKRKTADLDITLAISTWDDFEVVMQALVIRGFRKDKKVQQRLYYGHGATEFTLDVVPFGGVAIPDHVFSWPGEPDTRLSVVGFESALKHTYDIDMDGRFTFVIPTAPALFMLKLVAWQDRCMRLVYKDAIDLDFLIRSYYLENSTRDEFISIYEKFPDADEYAWGAAMIATDLLQVASLEDLKSLKSILDNELALEEQSKLLQHCIPEKAPDDEFDRIRRGWSNIQRIISEAIG